VGITSNGTSSSIKSSEHIDWATSVSAEARKGRLWRYADLSIRGLDALYNNRVLSKVNIGLSQYLVDGEAFYRVVEARRG